MKLYMAKTYDLQAAQEEQLYGLLDSDRIKKVSVMKSKKERVRSIFAGLLLRHAFLQAGYGTKAWQYAEIGKGKYGKPYIKGYQDFYYGLSHSGEWVICAVDTVPVGADIQEIKPLKMTLAKRFYHEEEYNRLLVLGEIDQNRQTQEFYVMWAAKESAVKLSGRGIGAGISQYVTAADYSYIYDCSEERKIGMRQYQILEGYIICVCSNTGSFPDLPEIVDL
ncbi:MAG: 4'-phosphopantetheinyl transferase superfamily protein [Lachnospiraceae bacterium]|nr:4'-phosphopantetheinyl transferase superfamily protein [Lachnospiraceae bacterium]